MKPSRIAALLLLSLSVVAFPRTAFATDTAYPISDLNLRSGPSTRFPAVAVMRRGSHVHVHGCIKNYTWCDVSAGRHRGWAAASYLDIVYSGQTYRVPVYAERAEIPVVHFEITSYWDNYYDDYEFYDERDRWYAYDWEEDETIVIIDEDDEVYILE
ncbi:SH3 domain-containing protein [Notoacmeibacter marinus]|nr:SH3 domain-containing protein [Notoacmeibacter marinus]